MNDINHIIEDREGRIWIATLGKGVFWIDNSGSHPGKINRLSYADGLVNDMVASLAQDRFGHIWIATQKGLTVYDPKTRRMRSIFTGTSAGSNSFTDRSVCQLSDGRLVLSLIHI